MCKWGTRSKVSVIRRANPSIKDGWHEIYVDSCLKSLIQEMNNHGIVTTNCCCGHGKGKGSVLIERGYEVIELKLSKLSKLSEKKR